MVDRDPLYTEGFRRILGQGGVKAVRLPARSPNRNAFAERFVLSIKSECLDRLVPLGEDHLRRAILEYARHYHEERNHQGLDNELIMPAEAANRAGKVDRRERLGGSPELLLPQGSLKLFATSPEPSRSSFRTGRAGRA